MARRPWLILQHADEDPALLGREPEPGTRIITMDALHQQLESANGRTLDLWEDGFPRERVEELDAAAAELRRNWCQLINAPDLGSALRFDSVDLLPILEYGLQFYFIEAVRNAAIASALFSEDTPSSVTLRQSNTTVARLLAQACAAREIPFECDSAALDTAVGGKRRGRNAVSATSQLWQFWRAARRFRRSGQRVRVLLRGPRVAFPFLEVNADRQAALPFRGGLTQLPAYLAVASIFNVDLWRKRREASALCRELTRRYQSLPSPQLPFGEFDLWPCVKPALDVIFEVERRQQHRFENRYAEPMVRSLREVLEDVLFCGHKLDQARPNVVLVAYDSCHLDKTMVSCARARGIPSAVLQHGITAAYFPVHADHVLTWGELASRFFTQHGVPTERLRITGRARRQESRRVDEDAASVRRELGVGTGEQVLLLIGQPMTGLWCGAHRVNWQLQMAGLARALADRKGLHLWVRPHPSETESEYLEALEALGCVNVHGVKSHSLLTLLDATDLVLLRDSTVCLDVIEREKPLIFLDLVDLPHRLFLEDFPEFPVARTPDELSRAIDELLATPQPAPCAQEFFSRSIDLDGPGAALEIHDALAELIAQCTEEDLTEGSC